MTQLFDARRLPRRGHLATEAETQQQLHLPLLPNEMWWGGAVADGQRMPFGNGRPHHRDLARSAGITGDPRSGNNQSAPLLLSNRGRFIWSEQPFRFDITDSAIHAVGSTLIHGRAGHDLKDAYRTASAVFFPGSGQTPALQMFRAPLYNTWICRTDPPRTAYCDTPGRCCRPGYHQVC